MFAVVVVYLGLITGFCGLLSLIKPPSWLGVSTRRQASYLVIAGTVNVVVGWSLPAKDLRAEPPHTRLDEFIPVYQFNEFHSIRVNAPREKVYDAIKAVTADEIPLFRALTWIRRGGRPSPEGILNPSHGAPILDVATRTSFLQLAEDPGRETVIGTDVVVPRGWHPRLKPTPEDFKNVHEPGFALAAMNFRLEDAGPGVTAVTTETRIFATDRSARRRVAAYWRVIYPGSSLIRYMWLRAIQRRAESHL